MLRIDIRELHRGPVETVGSLAPTAPLWEGLGLEFAGPVAVSGRLEASGRADYRWRGRIRGEVKATCRRCLTEFIQAVDTPIEALFSANPDLEDDPTVYLLEEPVTHVDVSKAVREELGLALTAYPLCRENCAGLCPHCGADLNQGPCRCGPVSP